MIFDNSKIRELRESKGLSLSEFGRPLGMKAQQVQGLEAGPGKPNVRTLERIMSTYGVPPEYFFVGEVARMRAKTAI
jgi:transcriptional regulator with XRE-family HTH domain